MWPKARGKVEDQRHEPVKTS